MNLHIKTGKRILLIWGNPRELANVVTKLTPRGNRAIYLKSNSESKNLDA